MCLNFAHFMRWNSSLLSIYCTERNKRNRDSSGIDGMLSLLSLNKLPKGQCRSIKANSHFVGTGSAQGTIPTPPVRKRVGGTTKRTGASPVPTLFNRYCPQGLLSLTL